MNDYSNPLRRAYRGRLKTFKGFKPYEYQARAYVDAMIFLEHSDDKSGLMTLPTGAGKSLLCSWISLSLYKSKQAVLMVVPSKELLDQNKEKIEDMGGIVGVFSGTTKETDKPLTIATVQSLNENSDALNKFKHILVDEAHFKYPYIKKGLFYKFVQKTKPKKILGMTATPFVREKTAEYSTLRVIPSIEKTFFKNMIHVTQVSEVIKEGRWCDLKYKSYPFVHKGLILNSNGTDYTPESVSKALKLQNVNNTCCLITKDIVNKTDTNRVIVFVDSLDTAELMQEYLKSKCSRRIETVSSDTKKKVRKEIINTFKNTDDIGAVINVGVLVRGLDCPPLTHVVLARPTNSLNSLYQMIGRLVRIHPQKEFGTVIDLCGNVKRFGKVENLNISYIKGLGWNCTNGDMLLTNVNMKLGGNPNVKDALKAKKPKRPFSRMKIEFGKFKGKLVVYLPKFYRDYLLKDMEKSNYIPEKNKKLLALLKKLRDYEESNLYL